MRTRNTRKSSKARALESLCLVALLAAPALPAFAGPGDDVEPESVLLDFAYASSGGMGAITDVEPADSAWTDKTFQLVSLPADALSTEGDLAADSTELSIGFGTDNAAWLLWDRETHYVDNEMTEAYQPGGDMFGQLNDHHDADVATPSATDRRARTGGDGAAPFVIDLIWNSALDLDLHVFEPTAVNGGRPVPGAPGHLWSKAPVNKAAQAAGQLKAYAFDTDKRLSAERYVLGAGKAAGLGSGLSIYVDYADRTKRKNAEPKTCAGGAYAAPTAKIRVTGPSGSKSYPVNIKPIACGTPVTLATAFTPVGQINYR